LIYFFLPFYHLTPNKTFEKEADKTPFPARFLCPQQRGREDWELIKGKEPKTCKTGNTQHPVRNQSSKKVTIPPFPGPPAQIP
jgi:hypothetical protein